MRQREGVINLKLTNSKNKVIASSHLHQPPTFSSPPWSCSAGYGWEEFFNCCSQLFLLCFTHTSLFVNLSHLFGSSTYPFIGLHLLRQPFFLPCLTPFTCIHLPYHNRVCQEFFCFFFFFVPRRKWSPYPGSLLHITRPLSREPVSLQGWGRMTKQHRKEAIHRQ